MIKRTNTSSRSRGTKTTRGGLQGNSNTDTHMTNSIHKFFNTLQSNTYTPVSSNNNINTILSQPSSLDRVDSVVGTDSSSLDNSQKPGIHLLEVGETSDPGCSDRSKRKYIDNSLPSNMHCKRQCIRSDIDCHLHCDTPLAVSGNSESEESIKSPRDTYIPRTGEQGGHGKSHKERKKKKHRKKAERKRTPKNAILPQKRTSINDNIPDNIRQLSARFVTIKAKRRRLYVKEQNQESDLSDGSVDSADTARWPPPRHSKTIALHKIREHEHPFPEGAYSRRNIQNLKKVSVAIAPSSLPLAGLGLFLLSGPAEDGSAPPGTRVATYDGIHFRTRKEQEYVRSDQYQSNYVWEGINPFTRETIMVDGSPLNSYGPYMNDGLAFQEANATLVFGTDGKIYVETITTVSKNAELFLSYGRQYWLDPHHWNQLPESVRTSVLQFYQCDPPVTPKSFPTNDDLSSMASSPAWEDQLSQCFGRSSDDTTRLSFWSLEKTSPIVQSLQDKLQRVSRQEAYQTLVQALSRHDIFQLTYWKKLDQTHYRDSPPDGACGWHTIAQAITRHDHNYMLDLNTREGQLQAASILDSLLHLQPSCSKEGLQSLPTAIDWIRKKHWQPRATLEYKYQLFCEDYTTILDKIPTTLFIQPSSAARNSSITMPNDLKHEWLSLHSTSSPNRSGMDAHLSAFPLRIILSISQGELFAQLAGGHYFLHPTLLNENQRCDQAIRDMANNLWDHLHSIRVELLQFPGQRSVLGQQVGKRKNIGRSAQPAPNLPPPSKVKPLLQPTILRSSPTRDSTIHEDQAKPPVPQNDIPSARQTSDNATTGNTQQQVVFSGQTLRHCYGKNSVDQLRLSLGSLTMDQQATISTLHMTTTREIFIETLTQALHDDPQFQLHVWRKKDYTLWNSSPPDGACGWYTIANLFRRAQALPLLNFSDQLETDMGVNILQGAINRITDSDTIARSVHACRWISSGRQSPFNAQHQLSSLDFSSVSGDIRTALFISPPYIDSPRMHTEEWILLYHHTSSPNGSALLTLPELLTLARDGNYAQLVEHHFWPLPVQQQECSQIQQAITDLVGNIWNFLEAAPYQSLLITSHHSNMVIDVDLREDIHATGSSRDQHQSFVVDSSGRHIAPPDIPSGPTSDKDSSVLVPSLEKAERTAPGEDADPTAIFALQKQLFNSDGQDNILETGTSLQAHLRTASLNINGLTQQKLPIILTYIKKKKVDILTLQDTRLDDKDSQLLATLSTKAL